MTMQLILAVVMSLAWLAGSAAATAPGPHSVPTFVMFPPENQTRLPDLGWVGEALAVSVSEEITSPAVEALSWGERVRFIESVDLPPNTLLSRGSMIRVAQKASADKLIFGSYSGTADNLRIVLHVLDLKTLKLSGEKVANGPMAALPQLENELAWVILADSGFDVNLSREEFRARTRKISNQAFINFINCLAVEDPAERARRLMRTLELNRNFPQASFLIGEYYFGSADWPHAIQYLQQALKSAQNFCDAEFMLGTSYLKEDDALDAIQAYSALIARSRSMEGLNNLGVAFARKGDYAEALHDLTEARSSAKSDLIVELNLAVIYHLQGEPAAAQAILDDTVKAHPDQGMAQFLYGVTLAERGETDKSGRAFIQARRLGIDTDKMKRLDPRLWTQIFPSWTYRATSAWAGEPKNDHD